MFSIAPYFVELLDEEGQSVDLWDFYKKHNFRDTLIDYYQNEMSKYNQISSNRLFRVAKLFQGNEICVAGQYETGEHGYQSNLYDIKDKKISHQKATTEADMLPFLFLFVLPKSDLLAFRKRGMLLLARHKTLGIRTLTIPHLKAFVEAKYPRFQLNVNRMFPAALARTLLDKGVLKNIRLVKYKMPNALEDLLDTEDTKQFQNLEVVIKSKRKGGFRMKESFMQLLDGKGSFRSIYQSVDFACDNIKLDVEIGGKIKRINVGKQRVSSDVDISDDIEIDRSGFPTAESWYAEVDQLGQSLLKSIGVEVNFATSTKSQRRRLN